ncbi:hypothetical protein LCGC14_0347650 [marine sediment metagenome]|uniref:Uncharacterized protein n=1 Tax=marine sediment metagenome TaxID=412755 RepID=A0A0F9WJP5_9ZZZZ
MIDKQSGKAHLQFYKVGADEEVFWLVRAEDEEKARRRLTELGESVAFVRPVTIDQVAALINEGTAEFPTADDELEALALLDLSY